VHGAWYTSLCRKQTHSVKSFACKSLHYIARRRKRVKLTRLLNFKENFCFFCICRLGSKYRPQFSCSKFHKSATSVSLSHRQTYGGALLQHPKSWGEQPLTLLPLFQRLWGRSPQRKSLLALFCLVFNYSELESVITFKRFKMEEYFLRGNCCREKNFLKIYGTGRQLHRHPT